MWAHIPWRGRAAPALRAEVQRRRQQLGWEHTIGHDPGGAVDVVDEEVEGGEPLNQPARDPFPLLGRYHTRNYVEEPRLVDVACFGVNGEGDAHRTDCQFCRLLSSGEFAPQGHQVAHHAVTGMPRAPIEKQLVPTPLALVALPHG